MNDPRQVEPERPDAIANSAPVTPESAMPLILDALRGLRFGVVTVVVHDGRVMQIDRTDRKRLG